MSDEEQPKACYSESFLLKLAVVPIVGIGTIFLGYTGMVGGEATVGILSALVGFLVGEANGVRKVSA